MSTLRWRTSPVLRSLRALIRARLAAEIGNTNADISNESTIDASAVGYTLPTIADGSIEIARQASKPSSVDTPSIFIEAQPSTSTPRGLAGGATTSTPIDIHFYLSESDLADGPDTVSESTAARLEQAAHDLSDTIERMLANHSTGALSLPGAEGFDTFSHRPSLHTVGEARRIHGRVTLTLRQQRNWL